MRKLMCWKRRESSWQCPCTAPVMGTSPHHEAGPTAVAPQAVGSSLPCGVMSALLCLSPGANPAEPLFLVTFLTVSDRRATFLLPQVLLTGLKQKAGGPGISWNQQKSSYDGHPHPIRPCQFVMPSGAQGLLTRCLLSTIFSHFSLTWVLLQRILAKHGRTLERSLGPFSRLQLGNISLEQVDEGLAGTTLPDFITREWDRDPYGGHLP